LFQAVYPFMIMLAPEEKLLLEAAVQGRTVGTGGFGAVFALRLREVDLVAKVPNSNRTKNGDTNIAVRQAAIADVYQELHTSLAVGEHPNLMQAGIMRVIAKMFYTVSFAP
jgi:hypothetical protein